MREIFFMLQETISAKCFSFVSYKPGFHKSDLGDISIVFVFASIRISVVNLLMVKALGYM